MLYFQGNISEPSRRLKDRVVFKNENNNEDVMSELASTMASVTTHYWNENIDPNVSAVLYALPSSDQNLNFSSYITCCKSTNLRG